MVKRKNEERREPMSPGGGGRAMSSCEAEKWR